MKTRWKYVGKSMFLASILFLTSCAFYTVQYTVETLDADGNVVTRHVAKGKALVANSSDQVNFVMKSSAEQKDIQFGKTGTNPDAQLDALGTAVRSAVCIANPALCAVQ